MKCLQINSIMAATLVINIIFFFNREVIEIYKYISFLIIINIENLVLKIKCIASMHKLQTGK